MEEQYVNSLIGSKSIFRGDLEVNGLIRVDGDYIGTVRKAAKVLIGSQGRADAVIHAKVVVIGGAFSGSVHASERAVLLSGSLVLGQINAPRIIVEPGALLSSSLHIHGDYQDQDLGREGPTKFGLGRKTYERIPEKTPEKV